uniref:Uncharacterized protein n=1 Tax=Steinernema glaseri TaxID=37863 RepID=A0A1I7ZHT0_9BILA
MKPFYVHKNLKDMQRQSSKTKGHSSNDTTKEVSSLPLTTDRFIPRDLNHLQELGGSYRGAVGRSGFFYGNQGDLWAATITLVFTATRPWEEAKDHIFKRFYSGLVLEEWDRLAQDEEAFIRSFLEPEVEQRGFHEAYKKSKEMYRS